MITPTEKLTKILHLEAEKYQNRAVFGGLGRYAETWLEEARKAFAPQASEEIDAWIEEIARRLRAYGDLSDQASRRSALHALINLVEDIPASPESAEETKETEETKEEKERESDKVKAEPETRHAAPRQTKKRRTGLKSPVTVLRGVGPRQSKRLAKLGIRTIRDMLYCFPRRYDDYSQLKPINRLEYGEETTIIAQVWEAGARKTRGGGSLFKATLSDGSGFIDATWFNQPYLANRIKQGQHIVISGQVNEYLGRLCFNSPIWEPLEDELLHTGRLVPVYPLTAGVRAKWLRSLMKRTVDYWSKRLPDHLPTSVKDEYNLMNLETAIAQIHFPEDKAALEKARARLTFDELFVVQIGLLRQRHQWRSEPGQALMVDEDIVQNFVKNLAFELTDAQYRALRQIVSDLRSKRPMNRLLQGDVGSGKTVVAAAAMALAVASNTQAALMAPTAILAEQHYQTLNRLFTAHAGPTPSIRFLSGDVTGQERADIYAGLASGAIDIIVGTHALIQENVQFKDLALAVIDEQHRFGVRQRAALRQKGGGAGGPSEDGHYNPHLLVMTATPIPRSLELTIWGHLDVSIIDEMPPGRKEIVTRLLLPTERERAYSFLRSQVEKGRQAFLICPLVEESDKIEAKAAVEEHERLQKYVFPDLRLGLLHGRMSGEEKEETMARFARGDVDILVSTAVVEVGIDVANATVMLIEGAERFGLSQLHQFRGRVGRGEHTSYCLLVSDSDTPEAQERLRAMEETSDGFVLAEKDLKMRGPGDFLGARQSGFPDLQLASISNLKLIETAREAARRFFESDPELEAPENRLLARQVARVWKGEGEIS
jgi:ATP-dependent DNA helicase RecG